MMASKLLGRTTGFSRYEPAARCPAYRCAVDRRDPAGSQVRAEYRHDPSLTVRVLPRSVNIRVAQGHARDAVLDAVVVFDVFPVRPISPMNVSIFIGCKARTSSQLVDSLPSFSLQVERHDKMIRKHLIAVTLTPEQSTRR